MVEAEWAQRCGKLLAVEGGGTLEVPNWLPGGDTELGGKGQMDVLGDYSSVKGDDIKGERVATIVNLFLPRAMLAGIDL